MQAQQRIQRTHRVALIPFTETGETIAVEVNLSYPLDEVPEIDHELIQAEAVDRLRRLARQGRATSTDGQPVTTDDIETRTWDVRLVRQTLVTVELDDDGKPVRKVRS